MTMESFGRILKEVRKAKKLTLQEIGNYIGPLILRLYGKLRNVWVSPMIHWYL